MPTCVKKADLNVSLKLFDLSESDDETEDERPASPKRVSEGEWDLPPCIDTPVSTADLSIEKDDINVIFNQLNISAQDPLIQDSKKRESGKVHKIQLDESRDENSSPLPLLARLQSKLSIKDRRPICFPKLSNMSNKAYK